MIRSKELLKRIVSLEESLGLKYVPGDRVLNHQYNEHITDRYGLINKVEILIGEIEKQNGKK